MEETKTILIGTSYMAKAFYHWMENSTKLYDILAVILEDECPDCFDKKFKILSTKDILCNELQEADQIFICSSIAAPYVKILLKYGISEEKILSGNAIFQQMNAHDKMKYSEEILRSQYPQLYNDPHAKIGAFTYGFPTMWYWNKNEQIIMGKFCSISKGVQIFCGGEHHTEWCTTYPFNIIVPDSNSVCAHPASKGNVVIGNDVWLANGATILSGVHIGDGAVIGANALVAKDIPPYAIVGGNPAKILRYRFDKETIQMFLKIQWWDWKYEHIYHAIPLLQNSRIKELFDYYENVVSRT